MSDSPGLRYLEKLCVGSDELNWLQAEYDQLRRDVRLGRAASPGWIGAPWDQAGQAAFGWRIGAGATAGTLIIADALDDIAEQRFLLRPTVTPFYGVTPTGQVLPIVPSASETLRDAAGDELVVPDDSTWYTLVARPVLRQEAPGVIEASAGSGVLVGTGTDFTRFATSPVASRFRIASGANAGEYTFTVITDANNATVTPVLASAETGVRILPIGRFLEATADPDLRCQLDVAWSRVARTVLTPDDGLIAYDVQRTGSTLTVIDRRRSRVYRPLEARALKRWHLVPDLETTEAILASDGTQQESGNARSIVYRASTAYAFPEYAALAPATVDTRPGLLGAFYTIDDPSGATWSITIRERLVDHVHGNAAGADVPFFPWRNPGGGVAVQPVASQPTAQVSDFLIGLALVKVPSASGRTHLLFYMTGTFEIRMLTSSDHGQTWSAPSVIFDDTLIGGSGNAGLDAILTPSGRILVTRCSFESRLLTIYSDDYGASWITNTGQGFLLVQATSDTHWPSMAVDAYGRLWTAYRRGNSGGDTGEIRLIKGAGEHDPSPSADSPSEGYVISPNDALNRGAGALAPLIWNKPRLLGLPDGQMLTLLHGLSTDGSPSNDLQELGAVYTAGGVRSRYQTLHRMSSDATPSSAVIPGIGACQAADGLLYTVWGTQVTTGDAYYDENRYAPVPMGALPIHDFT